MTCYRTTVVKSIVVGIALLTWVAIILVIFYAPSAANLSPNWHATVSIVDKHTLELVFCNGSFKPCYLPVVRLRASDNRTCNMGLERETDRGIAQVAIERDYPLGSTQRGWYFRNDRYVCYTQRQDEDVKALAALGIGTLIMVPLLSVLYYNIWGRRFVPERLPYLVPL